MQKMFKCLLVSGTDTGIKMVPFLSLLSCESSVPVKENPDRKKIYIVRIDTVKNRTKILKTSHILNLMKFVLIS